jgi:hypothetical protein
VIVPYIRWIDDDEAEGQVEAAYTAWKAANPGRDRMPEILKCFSQRPDFLKSVIEFSYPMHFQDGHLTRRIKEMIATYVSGLNQCPY